MVVYDLSKNQTLRRRLVKERTRKTCGVNISLIRRQIQTKQKRREIPSAGGVISKMYVQGRGVLIKERG